MNVRDLLKKATILRKENKIEDAIKVLNEAYKKGVYEPPSHEMEEGEEYTDFDKTITLQDLVRKAKYLQEIASQVDRENAVFFFNSSGDPAMMREGNDTSAIYVVMPMRV